MDIIKTNCPECLGALEFPRDFDNVICPNCETAFRVRRYKDAMSLDAIEMDSSRAASIAEMQSNASDLDVVESRIEELDELIAEASDELEEVKSRESSAPLQLGCAFFGLFMLAIMVIIGFMLLGRNYVGHVLFYLALGVAILLGLARARQKLLRTSQLEALRRERARLEEGLAKLETERERVLHLKSILTSDEPELPDNGNGV